MLVAFIIITSRMQQGSFKQIYDKQKRIHMFEKARQQNSNNIVAVVERDPKCKTLPQLKHNRFLIGKNNKFFEMQSAIRKRVIQMGQKYNHYALFIYTSRVIPNNEMSMGQIWHSSKDKQDSILYLKYGDVDPFGTV